MSDTTEYCPRCDGFIWYPTDALGRVIATCEACGFRPPQFVPRAVKPMPELRHLRLEPTPDGLAPVWRVQAIKAWLKAELLSGPMLRHQVNDRAKEDGLPLHLVATAINEMVQTRQVRREARGSLSLATPKGFTGQVQAWVEGEGRRVTPYEVADAFPAVALNAVRAALANLVAAGRLLRGGPDGARVYYAPGAERQEAA